MIKFRKIRKTKSKSSSQEEIKTIAEMNEIETKRIVHRIKKSKSRFFERKTGLTEL